MLLYDELMTGDILGPVWGKYPIHSDAEGHPKIYLPGKVDPSNIWLNTRQQVDRHCDVWSLYFNHYGIVPRGCRNCWKVVMNIKTLRQLMKIFEFQRSKTLPYNCKCGPETRPFIGKLGSYGAYWYGLMDEGLKGGRKMFRKLQQEFPGVKLILKRGCTEFEMRYSPSDKWDELAETYGWDKFEERLNRYFVADEASVVLEADPAIEVRILLEWMQYAESWGDSTAHEYKESSIIDYMKYNGSIHKDDDYSSSNFDEPKREILHGLHNWWRTETQGKQYCNRHEDANGSGERKVALISELQEKE